MILGIAGNIWSWNLNAVLLYKIKWMTQEYFPIYFFIESVEASLIT